MVLGAGWGGGEIERYKECVVISIIFAVDLLFVIEIIYSMSFFCKLMACFTCIFMSVKRLSAALSLSVFNEVCCSP